MRLGFDAKRALNNFTGLGNHARILLNAMMRDYPEHDYKLYSPKAKTELLNDLDGNFELVLPQITLQRTRNAAKLFGANTAVAQSFNLLKKGGLWRSWGITGDLLKAQVQLYHGLSNELPFNIHRTGIKTVVTIHDLIFLKHTEQYPFIDRRIYELKTRYAAKHANRIIAVSEETKADLSYYYKTPLEKIEVIYPSADAAFQTGKKADFSRLNKYDLPEKYILHVGSFFPRKNQLKVIDAYRLIRHSIAEKLVLVGSDGSMKDEVEAFIGKNELNGHIKIISGIANEDMPALYQKASLFVFPSLYEGFGAPVLEALFSRVPVIATRGGAIEEAAGKSAVFIDPANTQALADAMLKVLGNESLKGQMIEAGYIHAQIMTDRVFAGKVMKAYGVVMGK